MGQKERKNNTTAEKKEGVMLLGNEELNKAQSA